LVHKEPIMTKHEVILTLKGNTGIHEKTLLSSFKRNLSQLYLTKIKNGNTISINHEQGL
jgi:hypothetical protein